MKLFLQTYYLSLPFSIFGIHTVTGVMNKAVFPPASLYDDYNSPWACIVNMAYTYQLLFFSADKVFFDTKNKGHRFAPYYWNLDVFVMLFMVLASRLSCSPPVAYGPLPSCWYIRMICNIAGYLS